METSRVLYLILAMMLCAAGCKKSLTRMNTPLHRAAEAGDVKLIHSLIAGCADINAKDDWDGSTPLHIAVDQGHSDIAEVLIEAGASINARNVEGMTPLHKACFNGNKDIIELLVFKGADVNAKDKRKRTPLHEAIGADFHDSAKQLLKSKRADINSNGEKTEPSWNESQELAENIKIEVVRFLISKGADVNAKDYFGGTPLYDAVYWASTDVIEILLESGANPNVQDKYGSILLYEVIADGYTDVVRLLFDYRAEVNIVDASGQTPLHEVAWNDHKDMAELIIDKGADVNVKDRNGDTPLHAAALNGYTELYDLLIKNGADLNVRNKQGRTPGDYANSFTPKNAVMLSEPNESPYIVIITNLLAIRHMLRSEVLSFDRILIPEESDIEGLDAALKSCLENKTPVMTRTWFSHDHILANFGNYNREYGTFFKNGKKYVICNMIAIELQKKPYDNEFSPYIYDAGCSLVRVLFNVSNKKVISINCG